MAMTLITTNTSSNAATSSFTSGIDNTYKLYIFKFIDVNPATDSTNLMFNGSIDGGSNYNVTKTTTMFGATHGEDGGSAALNYYASSHLAQSTAFTRLGNEIGNGSDECNVGTLWLFNPSSTTYVKHFYGVFNAYQNADKSYNDYIAGYFNNTNDIDAVQFKMGSGNMDAVIKMYGVG